MKIAVTAASGQLGSTIIQQLVKEVGKENVIGIARTPKKADHLPVEIKKADYNNYQDLKAALKNVNTVLLISGMDHPDKRIQQHRNVIEAAKVNWLDKIVYTSISGSDEDTAFSPIVRSNRQTEEDIKVSGMDWVIGRNGLYIEPDLEYLENYKNDGSIINCAGDGLCSYTSRTELAIAYSKMILQDKHNGNTYNLTGHPISQSNLCDLINQIYGTQLGYKYISTEEFSNDRKNDLGEFLGSVIAGIYDGISKGYFNTPSDFDKATERPHKHPLELIQEFKTITEENL